MELLPLGGQLQLLLLRISRLLHELLLGVLHVLMDLVRVIRIGNPLTILEVTILPVFDVERAIREVELSLAVLLVVQEATDVHCAIGSPQSPLPVAPVSLPHSNVSLSRLEEGFALAMSLATHPVALIEVAIVEVAAAKAVPLVVCPLALVLIVAHIRAILGNKSALPFTHSDSQGTFVIAVLVSPQAQVTGTRITTSTQG